MKRLMSVIAVLLCALALSACRYTPVSHQDGREPVIVFVAGVGTLDDGSFNNGIAAGLRKGCTEFGYDLKILEAGDETTHQDNLNTALETDPVMIVADYTLTDAVIAAAEANPSVHYVLVDSSLSEDEDLPDNLLALHYDNAEGAFLMGVAAAAANTTGTVGFIGGSDEEPVTEAETGFKAGVRAVDASEKVLVENIASFSDTEKAGKAAENLHAQGAGVIFGFAGGANYGLLENAAEKDYWCIGADQDQALVYPEMASHILCSMVKNLDNTVYNVVKSESDGSFKGGIQSCGISNGGIVTGAGGGNLTSELQATVNQWRQAIADGKVSVPKTEEELAGFKVPAI